MKKSLYIAATLLAAVGCVKSELVEESVGTHDIQVSVTAGTESGTKAVFDGDSHIKFEKGDAFYAAIAKADAPTKGIKVATKSGYAAEEYYSSFSISDAEAVKPEFKGSLYSIVEADFADEYCFYGVFPSGAVNTIFSEEDLTAWAVNLADEQTATQTSWYNRADVMLMQPTTISTSEHTYDEKYGEYSTSNHEQVKFAHLFGFGKISFASVPEIYASQVVKSIKIEAVGDNKALAGRYTVDITKDIEDVVPVPASTKSSITLKGDGVTTVSDYVAWFVANPGTFDVKITVFTNKADLIFERENLVITRSTISSPTVNFKSTDVTESHDVVLEDGENWTNTLSYSKIITSSYKERAWGDGDKKMNFSISYPGSTNSNYGSSLSVSTGVYAQALAYNLILGGKVVLSSAADFSGMKEIKVNLGIYTADVTADFTLSVVKDGVSTDLGKVSITGDNKSAAGKDYYFKTTPESESGQLVLTVDNFSDNNCRPYVGTLSINPAPAIVLDKTAIKVDKTAHSEVVDCEVFAADGAPVVTVEDEAQSWLSASWEDNKLTLTVTENTGSKRSGKLTLKAVGLSETVQEVTVTQSSATEVLYKLSVSAADMYKVLKAEKDKLEAEGTEVDNLTGYPVTAKFEAVGVDDPTKKTEVEISANKLYLGTATEESFKTKGSLKCTSPVGIISKVVVVADRKLKAGNYDDIVLQISENGTSWKKVASSALTYEGDTSPYTTTATIDDETANWFDISVTAWGSATLIYSFEITFLVD